MKIVMCIAIMQLIITITVLYKIHLQRRHGAELCNAKNVF